MSLAKFTACRGRPRGFDAEKGVAVAERLFRERGYDAVGVAELVQAIGIKPPSFYAAYGSKKELLERVLKRYGSHDGGEIGRIIRRGGPLAETADRLFQHAAECYANDPKARGCLILEGTRNSHDDGACAITRRAHSAFREGLVEWIAASAPEHAEALAQYVQVVLAGMSAEARSGAGTEQLRTTARIAARGFRAELQHHGISDT